MKWFFILLITAIVISITLSMNGISNWFIHLAVGGFLGMLGAYLDHEGV